ncbi:MAG TPA: SDR family oxidoreductase [Steroidobacter sp.]|jgi:NAD(P)-dependent dehydrogenase (short-subunit alcohol dehydrogenase family)|nr:SDR family oxidoreductase [Steroidobacter sp.]
MSQLSRDGVALVTGGNKGIGFEVARQLSARGFHVLLGARDAERGRAAATSLKTQGARVDFEHLDVSDDESVREAARRINAACGKLDILVNNAGVLLEAIAQSRPSSTAIDILRLTCATNVFGVAAVTNAMLPLLRRSVGGRIVNVSSKLASLSLADRTCHGESQERYFNLLAYNTSKAALNALTLQYAIELRDSRIKVNAVDPGHCATDINGRIGDRHPSEAAKVVVAAATLPDDGPTGAFISEDGRRAW